LKIEAGRVLDRLPAEERCLGAVFTSYSFDPAFFEENALRAVLRGLAQTGNFELLVA